ncbi:SMI1/KNR4 family protein [Streptomyces sp. NPDC091371]|uniref:SMI1/KNR4 family protein n=1 Tax=Streptomyces sp. NPDC091371 TaxID=3155303 RepID=UPI003439C6FE
MSDWDADAVRARLRQRAARGPRSRDDGWHGYELSPPLPEARIRAFEDEHGIRLPASYRAFVATVGDGPAGPGYGLMPLLTPRPADDWAVDDEWEQDRQPGRLAAPCPMDKPRPFDANRRFDEREGVTRGTLVLADHGCGTYSRLVVTGPRAGQVWHVDQDFGSCVPESPDFRTWYTDWLEQ